jgi:hypothetical protein
MLEKKENTENLFIEINSLRLSQNKDFLACISGVIQGVVDSCVGKLAPHCENCLETISRFVSSDTDRVYLLKELEAFLQNKPLQAQYHLVVKVLYENEVVDGDCILEWYKNSVCEVIKELVSAM